MSDAEQKRDSQNSNNGIETLLGNDVDWLAESEKHTEYENDIKKEPIDKTMIKFPVRVFVRLRPLIKEEIEQKHEKFEYNTKYIKKTKSTKININDITKKQRQSSIKRKNKKNNKIPIKKFSGFNSILSETQNNNETFKQCILPSIENIFSGFTICSFAYGHTGSGKTHTILGYDQQKIPGMYTLTVKYVCDKLAEINKNISNKDDHILLSCRFAELYQGKIRDLFSKNLVECHVREDDKGNINIRGPTIKDEETGQVKVQPLTPFYIKMKNSNELIKKVNKALKFRKQGSSATHDESSRSHVFLEMELVTNKLVEARFNLWNAEGELVPVGKARDDQLILIQSKQFIMDPQTGQYTVNKNYVEPVEEKQKLQEIQKEFLILEKNVMKCEERVNEVMRDSDNCIGGTIVFVDLAGNEWGSDSKHIKNDNKIQASERKEINKSLLSLKECVRALHMHKEHVPYRDSKLTMVLRPHLKGINSTAIMIANVSPSKEHILKTYNTLSYSQLVAKA
eukprot:54943_1